MKLCFCDIGCGMFQRTNEQKFALQLQQLSIMGFSDDAANLEGTILLWSKNCIQLYHCSSGS